MITTTAPTVDRTIRATLKASSQPQFLIIGYGNELRGDDAVGPRVAMSIAKWQLNGVKALAVHQLTPDLASDVSRADYVIFVDACGREHGSRAVQLEPVAGSHLPNSLPRSTTDRGDPWVLLNLAQEVYSCAPQGWLLQIPTECFDMGASLSSTAQTGCDLAIRTIEQFLQNYQ